MNFIRVDASTWINLNQITWVHLSVTGNMEVRLSDGAKFNLEYDKYREVNELLVNVLENNLIK